MNKPKFYQPTRADIIFAAMHRGMMNAAFRIRQDVLRNMRESGLKWAFDSEGLLQGEEELVKEFTEVCESYGRMQAEMTLLDEEEAK